MNTRWWSFWPRLYYPLVPPLRFLCVDYTLILNEVLNYVQTRRYFLLYCNYLLGTIALHRLLFSVRTAISQPRQYKEVVLKKLIDIYEIGQTQQQLRSKKENFWESLKTEFSNTTMHCNAWIASNNVFVGYWCIMKKYYFAKKHIQFQHRPSPSLSKTIIQPQYALNKSDKLQYRFSNRKIAASSPTGDDSYTNNQDEYVNVRILILF